MGPRVCVCVIDVMNPRQQTFDQLCCAHWMRDANDLIVSEQISL